MHADTFPYIVLLSNIILNSFVFKSDIENGRTSRRYYAALGAGGPEFNLGAPTKNIFACFLQFIESAVHPNPHLWNSGRQEVYLRKWFGFIKFIA